MGNAMSTDSSTKAKSRKPGKLLVNLGDRIVWMFEGDGNRPASLEGGTIRWLGTIDGDMYAGVELDNALGFGSGWFENKQLFTCEKDHGVLLCPNGLILERDFHAGVHQNQKSMCSSQKIISSKCDNDSCSTSSDADVSMDEEEFQGAGDVTSAKNDDDKPTPERESRVTKLTMQGGSDSGSLIKSPLCPTKIFKIEGTPRGIEGFQNSCYIDSTLFCMFSFSTAFDYLLYTKEENGEEDAFANEVRRILLHIVNTLRSYALVSSDCVMALRQKLQALKPEIVDQELDTQEFLSLIFDKVLKVPEFLKLSLGQNDHFHQLLIQQQKQDEYTEIPSVQTLLEKSFTYQNLKLKAMPNPVLILQMPRDAANKASEAILPTLTLDVGPLLDVGGSTSPVNTKLDLYAVICIKTNHFTSFVRCGNATMDTKTPWVFFDSMFGTSTQQQHVVGRTAPTITSLQSLSEWLDDAEKKNCKINDLRKFPSSLQDLLQNIYMCFYLPSSAGSACLESPSS